MAAHSEFRLRALSFGAGQKLASKLRRTGASIIHGAAPNQLGEDVLVNGSADVTFALLRTHVPAVDRTNMTLPRHSLKTAAEGDL